MLTNDSLLFVLGGNGFIGQYVIREAVRVGWKVKALVRSAESARVVSTLGASTVMGEAGSPDNWIHEAGGTSAFLDLIQPKLPKRVGIRQMRQVSEERQTLTRAYLAALRTLHNAQRPTLISVSGIDDLSADREGYISANSSLRKDDRGFNPIGIPVRKLIEQSGIAAAFVYLGTVYGPGKNFAESIFPAVAAGKWKNFAQDPNRMNLIHVEDAARGLVQAAGMETSETVGKSIVLTDSCPVEMNSFFGLTARLMGVSAPGRIPGWLAAMVAGRSLVEATTSSLPVKFSCDNFPGRHLNYPSYREGLPVTLDTLGYIHARGSKQI